MQSVGKHVPLYGNIWVRPVFDKDTTTYIEGCVIRTVIKSINRRFQSAIISLF